MDLISLIIINYNNKDYLERCMNSILKQTYKNIEIIFIDNKSKDGSFDFFNSRYNMDNIKAINNEINNGYAGAANQGIRMATGTYIMILNPDIIMTENFIEELYKFAETDSTIGAVSGKLLKYDFQKDMKLNYIDSAGIEMFRSRRCIDRGQNEEDKGQYDNVEQVFGVCGAAPFYRKSALEDIKVFDEYFDEDFFAYKEDVDLSWRMNLLGYKNMYYPKAIAYHGRGLGRSKGGKLSFIKHRKTQSEFLRGISYRNQILMLKKNETEDIIKRDRLKKLKRDSAFMIYSCVFERFNFKYSKQAKDLEKKIMKKRDEFFKKREHFSDISNLIK